VLVCLFSPNYFASLPCGREVELFRKRLAQLNGEPGVEKHRILPVFWIGRPQCHDKMQPHVREFLEKLQLTQKGLPEGPEGYPNIGIQYFYGDKQENVCFRITSLLAERVVELSNLPALPKLADETDFNSLASFFASRDNCNDQNVALGPNGTNVVYAVATQDVVGDPSYGVKAEDWRPFADKPMRTIGLLTGAGLADAGQNEAMYRAISLSSDLLEKIKTARNRNSPVLMVLDQASLRFDSVKKHIAGYDEYDAPHIGLVTAGGDDGDSLLKEVFATKYLGNRPHHLWTVPPSSEAYERQVAALVSTLRANIQKFSQTKFELPPSTMPSL
jgi:hypothetical protein